ncbi:ATP-binding protein [Dyadobacter fermentans]|uniref:AAA ATPase n=1 Tax=Dyadobacter fermentans (strain ATCC 700827 / DSM 18053 / CIP 107007 / KCTC 52180 / NS114) TaxID=471854 RepID=C6W0V8_DYAFD|nr:ATP-binding protein [Dyadobacter fermentans]ACT95413.1 AAA ATPase [Dyadobacter fermentans DSM 18053]
MIRRSQQDAALGYLFKSKALIIYGPRQAGKTTFSEQLLEMVDKKTLRLNGDDADTREAFLKPNATLIERIIGDHEVVFIDEAQRIQDVGLVIKIIVDRFKHVQVIATGSSSFELAGNINEPLTGRRYEMQLLPVSYAELVKYTDYLTEQRLLEQRLIYGSYPEIATDPVNAEKHLKLIANSYLYKDLLVLEQVKKPVLLEKIVKAIALQVGSEVSVTEIGRLVQADNKTVEKYIDLLEKAFVLFTVPAFSGNVRNEIKKGRKIYFYDNGIINAVINNFNPIKNRNDVGALWENYLISERKKFLNANELDAKIYFWRTTQQQEVDYIEEIKGNLRAIEFKWNSEASARFPSTFLTNYPKVKATLVTPANRDQFLTSLEF